MGTKNKSEWDVADKPCIHSDMYKSRSERSVTRCDTCLSPLKHCSTCAATMGGTRVGASTNCRQTRLPRSANKGDVCLERLQQRTGRCWPGHTNNMCPQHSSETATCVDSHCGTQGLKEQVVHVSLCQLMSVSQLCFDDFKPEKIKHGKKRGSFWLLLNQCKTFCGYS